MSKHTPGPWKAAETPWEAQGYTTRVVAAGDTTVAMAEHNWHEADVGERRISWAEAQANARLIAEAPAMLEALRGIGQFGPTTRAYRDWADEVCAILTRIEQEA